MIEIPAGRKIDDHKTEYADFVSGVEVTAHRFIPGSEAKKIFEGVCGAGELRVAFKAPHVTGSLSAAGAQIVKAHVNYALLSVPTDGNVILSGVEYLDVTHRVGTYMPGGVPSGEFENTAEVKDATLLDTETAKAVSRRLFTLLQNRHEDTGRLILGEETVGSAVALELTGGRYLHGTVTQLDIDLTGGFTAAAKIVGKVAG